jgi:hypothetical protein
MVVAEWRHMGRVHRGSKARLPGSTARCKRKGSPGYLQAPTLWSSLEVPLTETISYRSSRSAGMGQDSRSK